MYLFLSLLLVSLSNANEIPIACTRDGDLAFTFDQGPSIYTGKLLVALQKTKMKATFHFVPDYLDNPILLAYLKKAVADGHLIGLAVKHAQEADDRETMSRIEAGRKALQKHTNYAPIFLRFPIDAPPSSSLLATLVQKGMKVTGYNLDSQDYLFVNDTSGSADTGAVYGVFKGVLDAIEPPAKGSFIAVQRDLVGPSVMQAEAIFNYAKGKGYRAVRLDECLGVSSASSGGSVDKSTVQGESADSVNSSNAMSSSVVLTLCAMAALLCLMM